MLSLEKMDVFNDFHLFLSDPDLPSFRLGSPPSLSSHCMAVGTPLRPMDLDTQIFYKINALSLELSYSHSPLRMPPTSSPNASK